MSETILEARNDSRKDFYGKARVKQEGKRITLISYETEVAYIEDGKAFMKGFYSMTTTRHIKEFLVQNGFRVVDKAQLIKDYYINKEVA